MKPSALDALPTARRKIVIALKVSGELGAEQIALRVHTSAGAARQQLIAMRGEGYLQTRALRDGPGRPRLLYSLSGKGEDLFPTFSPEQFTGVLEAAREIDAGVLERILDRMTQRYFEKIRDTFAGESLEEQFEAGMDLLRDQGYLAGARPLPGHRWQVTVFHCPFEPTATRVPELCQSELRCFELFCCGGEVTRISRRPDGDTTCTYLFRPAERATGPK